MLQKYVIYVIVFKDLGFPNPDEELLRAELAYLVYKEIQAKKLTQEQAAVALKITQPDISKLKNGHYKRFTVERLIQFLSQLDLDINIRVTPSKHHEGHGHVSVSAG